MMPIFDNLEYRPHEEDRYEKFCGTINRTQLKERIYIDSKGKAACYM
jgi:hypothetical protein